MSKLFYYGGVDRDKKEKFGYIYAENRREAISTLKNSGVILITSLDEKRDVHILRAPRKLFLIFRTRLSKELKEMEERREENKRVKEEERQRRLEDMGISDDDSGWKKIFPTFAVWYNTIKLNFNKRRTRRKDRLEEAQRVDSPSLWERLKNIFLREDTSLGGSEWFDNIDLSQIDTSSDRRVYDPRLEDMETMGINWELIETRERYKNRRRKIKIKKEEIVMFTKRLRIMLISGISTRKALEVLQDTNNMSMQFMLKEISEDFNSGEWLSLALSKFPDQFGATYVSLVAIGEETGQISQVLEKASTNLEKEYEISRKIRTASIYPMAVGVVLAVVAFLGSKFMIPQFRDMFDELAGSSDVRLPFITELVFGISDRLPAILVGLIIFILIFTVLRQLFVKVDIKYTEVKDRLKLITPKFQDVFNSAYMYEISSSIALMLGSGISLIDSINLTKYSVGNVFIEKELNNVARLIEQEAYTFSQALDSQKNMDKLLVSMAYTGEESGQTASILEEVSHYFEDELNNRVNDMMELVQPLSIILIALLVVPVVFAIFIPLLDMQSLMTV